MSVETVEAIEIKVPALPESVADAIIVTWHKQPGEWVAQDENLVDIETDKVVLEVVAPQTGVLKQIIHPESTTVIAEQVIGIFEAQQEQAKKNVKASSPSIRRILSEHAINPELVESTGKGGRLTKEDVLKHIDEPTKAQATKPQQVPQREKQVPQRGKQVPQREEPAQNKPLGQRLEKRVPMTRLRARIAERLLLAQQNAAILTTFNEIDMSYVLNIRAKYRQEFEQAHGVRLGIMSFFVKAVLEALLRFPILNASIDGNDIVYHGYFDIGIAVFTERGLVVPILRNAVDMGMAQIEQTIRDYGMRAKQGKLSIDEMTGGTFTISNGGVFGSLLSTPIINPPQSGILGMHKIQDRAVVVNGEIVIRPMMYVALSYDHRVVDGKESVSFLNTTKQMLEDPARLLLQV